MQQPVIVNIKGLELRSRQGPACCLDPAAAVIELAGVCLLPSAAAHEEQANRRVGVDTVPCSLEPPLEPAPPKLQPGWRHITCDRRGFAEIGVAGEGRVPVAVQPRAHDQRDWTLFTAGQTLIIVE